jgi:ribonuclease Z
MHPQLVNGRTGDPAVYVETLFENRAILLDLGDLTELPSRKILRLDHVFVSHAHIDHFVGFDRLLRLLVGREKTVRLHGSPGLIERVGHKLRGYEWNLVGGYECDLVFHVSEMLSPDKVRCARFRLKQAFAREDDHERTISHGVLYEDAAFRVSATALEHRNTVSLAFAIEEAVHVNVWKNRLFELGLEVGPWLRDLKRAVREEAPPDTMIAVAPSTLGSLPLGRLREVLTIAAGQKIGYVTDVADTAANRSAIVDLVRGADILFIEAMFAQDDGVLARERGHLTTAAAGEIARAAGARRVEPFHFSPRYAGQDDRMLREVQMAFENR